MFGFFSMVHFLRGQQFSQHRFKFDGYIFFHDFKVVNSNGVCFFFKKAQCIPEINFPEINFPEINFPEIIFPEIIFPENLPFKNCYFTVFLKQHFPLVSPREVFIF